MPSDRSLRRRGENVVDEQPVSADRAKLYRRHDHIDDLCALIDQLGLDHVTLIAQDWGGAIGLGAMQRMPERLGRIVLFNTGTGLKYPPPVAPPA